MATEADNVNSGALGTLLAVGAFVTLGIALVVTALVRSEMNEELQKKEVGADQPFHDLVNEQSAKLNAPAAYIDRGKGMVSLPIERAMELTVSGLKKDPNSATPPGPAGGSGGGSAEATTGGASGMGGAAAAPVGGEAKPPAEAIHAEEGKDDKKPEGTKPAADKPEKKKEPQKAPAATPPVPAAPAPAPAPPAPAAPAPAPNGQ